MLGPAAEAATGTTGADAGAGVILEVAVVDSFGTGDLDVIVEGLLWGEDMENCQGKWECEFGVLQYAVIFSKKKLYLSEQKNNEGQQKLETN